MVRLIAIVGLLLGVAGCGESRTTRVVPVTPTSSGPVHSDASQAATRPARAIATH